MIAGEALKLSREFHTIDPVTALTVASAGLSLVQGIKGAIEGDRLKELQQEVLNERLNFARRQTRIARGEFTRQEREQIQRGVEPQLNRLQASLASRGLSQSGAGAQILSEARQAPFLSAQQAAQAGQAPALAGAQSAIDRLVFESQQQQQQFFGGLQQLSQAFFTLQQMNAEDPLLETGIDQLYKESIGVDPIPPAPVAQVPPGRETLTV